MLLQGHVADTTWAAQIFPDNFIPRCPQIFGGHQLSPGSSAGVALSWGNPGLLLVMPPLEERSWLQAGGWGRLCRSTKSLITPSSLLPLQLPVSPTCKFLPQGPFLRASRGYKGFKEFTQTRKSAKSILDIYSASVVSKYLFWPTSTISGTVGTIAHKKADLAALTNKR